MLCFSIINYLCNYVLTAEGEKGGRGGMGGGGGRGRVEGWGRGGGGPRLGENLE